jgi:hypothetical protein
MDTNRHSVHVVSKKTEPSAVITDTTSASSIVHPATFSQHIASASERVRGFLYGAPPAFAIKGVPRRDAK